MGPALNFGCQILVGLWVKINIALRNKQFDLFDRTCVN